MELKGKGPISHGIQAHTGNRRNWMENNSLKHDAEYRTLTIKYVRSEHHVWLRRSLWTHAPEILPPAQREATIILPKEAMDGDIWEQGNGVVSSLEYSFLEIIDRLLG